jgi:beta-barrel assembly-enhancing protease
MNGVAPLRILCASAMLVAAASLFGCVSDSQKGDGTAAGPKTGFLSGFSGVDLQDVKGHYISTLDLKGQDYAADVANQDRDLTLALTNELGQFESVALDRYVNKVMAKIAAAAAEKGGVTNFHPRAVVYADANPNAFAMPSGIILVSYGLLEKLENEDQLAFVLGHEASHVLLRHHDKDWFLTSQQHTVSTGEVGIQAMGKIEQTTGHPGIGADAKKWQSISDGILLVSRDFVVPSWSRNQEDQADLLGLDLMAAAGYQPRAAVGVVDMMTAMLTQQQAAGKSPERQAAEQALKGSAPASSMGSQFMGKLLTKAGEAIDSAVSAAKESYRSPEERKAFNRDYARREYRSTRTAATVTPYKAALAEPTTRTLLIKYALTTDALKKLGDHQTRAALGPALKGVEGVTSSHSYPRIVLSKTYIGMGQRTKAMDSLRIALRGHEPALYTYLSLAEMLARQRKFKESVTVLQSALKRYPKSALATVQLVSVQARAGNRTEAEALGVKCRLAFPEVKDRCIEATKGRGPLDTSA